MTNLPDMEFVMERLSQLCDYYNRVSGGVNVLRKDGVTYAVLFGGNQNFSILPERNLICENDEIAVLEFR